MIYLVDEQKGDEIPISRDCQIGREEAKGRVPYHIQIPYQQISRTHAKILNINGNFFIQDLNSTNGTFINGKRINPGVMYPLYDQNIVNFGEVPFTIRLQDEDNDEAQQSLNLDLPLGEQDSASLSIRDSSDEQPDVSVVMDASQVINQLRGKVGEKFENYDQVVKRLQAMIEVSIALGEIENRHELLKKITDTIFHIFDKVDRVTIISHNEKTGQSRALTSVDKFGHEEKDITISTTLLNEVLNNRNSLLLMDAMSDSRFESQDSVVDLLLRSVMCAPLLFNDQVLGFIQVDTMKGKNLFTKEDLQVLTGIASQVAISLKNSQLFEEIESLFEGFVKASVQAIEARDPATAGHSFRVAEYTEKLAKVVDATDKHGFKDVNFDCQQIQELRYASLLHDFGKVGVREHILTKANKLYSHEVDLIKQRFKYARAALENNLHKGLIEKHINEKLGHTEFIAEKRNLEKQLKEEVALLENFLNKILLINEPQQLTEELQGALDEIYQYQISDDSSDNIITDFEFSLLGLSYGSLNPEERLEIESHVSHTFEFLKLIPWTGQLCNVPDIAHAHHERLDGTGYPRGLSAEDIPLQSRIMAITDVFDALTAGDRPYRQGVGPEQALDIIAEEVKKGRLDKALFNVFVESDSYKLN